MIYQNSSGGNRELSLVEQKKRQWQKEREEMAKLGEFPIKIESLSSTKYEKTSIRTFYTSNVDLTDNYRGNYRKTPSQHGSFYDSDNRRLRSPSLPPIGRPKYPGTVVRQSTTEDDTGYTSGSPQHSDSSGAEVWTNEPQKVAYVGSKLHPNSYAKDTADDTFSETTTSISQHKRESQGHKMSPDSLDLEHETDFSKSLSTPSSSSSGGQSFASFQAPDFVGYKVKEERAKWGDRGVTVGHLYDPIARVEMEKSARSVPVWLEKGLHEMRDVRDSEDESVKSFIRGQNTPIDPQVLEERANRRRKAMELQEAIKEQLKDRERQKKWEKERRLREERLEEERLMRQMEMERARFEYDQRVQQEKLEKERKKHDMMRRAIVKAEMDAKMEKDRRKHRVYREASPPPVRERVEAPGEPKKSEEVKEDENTSEEKVLIGTPIKLKKQMPSQEEVKEQDEPQENLPEKPVVTEKNRSTDIDGIALVLQTMTPVVPLPIASDFLNATVNNLQLALLLRGAPGIIQEGAAGEPEKISMRESHNRECSYCCKIHGNNANTPPPPPIKEEAPVLETESMITEETAIEELPPKLPHEGTFTKEDVPQPDTKIDVATSTTIDASEALDKVLTPRKYRRDSSSSVDVAVQTEIPPKMCNLCCHHKLYLQEISTVTTSVTQTKNKVLGELKSAPEGESASDETITTTTTTKTMIRSKSKGKKVEPRPKWGVNRPLMQYIKASERDPFCLRQRRKKYQQRSFVAKPESPKSASKHRNICTEILPIKTDSNGRIFLNFHEASVMMKEDPVMQGVTQARERIMSKRGEEQDKITAKDNKDFSNLAIVKASSARRQSSYEDVDTEECTSEMSSQSRD